MQNDIRAMKQDVGTYTTSGLEAVEREKRAIYGQIEMSGYSLNDLEYAIANLEDQLSPLLSPEPAADNEQKKETLGNSPMYYGLAEQQTRIDTVTARLRRLLRTLEV